MTGQHVRIIINPRVGVYSWLYRPFRLLPFLAISASQEGKNQRQSGQWWGRRRLAGKPVSESFGRWASWEDE